MAVVLVGTLDTKGRELAFVRDLLRGAGLEILVIDASTAGTPEFAADVDRDRVLFRAGTTIDELTLRGDRGAAVTAAAEGAAAIVADLEGQGKVDGVLAIGGSAGTTIGTSAMRRVAFGVPKLMVSTLASGQVGHYVGGSDIAMLHSVADVAGLNSLTRTVLANAAAAMIGMVKNRVDLVIDGDGADAGRPVVGATMFGVTTPCVERARAVLEGLGCEVIVFHATGTGGRALEGLIRDGKIDGVLDITTTELADELVGGVLSAGPDRLGAAARRGTPQVVSVGALDMVNFGPMATVPDRFAGRLLHAHNPTVTLMRTTSDENAELGRRLASMVSTARGPAAVMLPGLGVSGLDAPGRPFHDPAAAAALFGSIRDGLAGHDTVRVVTLDQHINDPEFAEAAAKLLYSMMRAHPDPTKPYAAKWAEEDRWSEFVGELGEEAGDLERRGREKFGDD